MNLHIAIIPLLLIPGSLQASESLWDAVSFGSATGAETSLNHWSTSPHPLDITEIDGTLNFVTPENGEQVSSTSRYVKVSPGYRFLTIDATYEGAGNYRYFYVGLSAGTQSSLVTMGGRPQSGMITLPVPEALLDHQTATLRVDVISGTLRLARLALEENPRPRLELRSGDDIATPLAVGEASEIFIELEHPAEGVTITFIHARDMRPFRINGEESMELRPANSEGTQWKGELRLKEVTLIDLPPGSTVLAPGALLLRADILIGETDKPIWTINPRPISIP